MPEEIKRTAFVFAGGGSLGSIQVGMLRALAANGTTAHMVVGSSVGALNAAYYAGANGRRCRAPAENLAEPAPRGRIPGYMAHNAHVSAATRLFGSGGWCALARRYVSSALTR